ncbi:acyl-CoA synthetase, partial [Staphylococcus aureus]
DDDMDGLDLAGVHTILNGSERVHPATLKRFAERFGRFNFAAAALRPAYGMAEATVYIATRNVNEPPDIVDFESEKLPAGQAIRCPSGSGTPLVSYGIVDAQLVRIVDPDTGIERPAGTIGEIWVHGDNVAIGYWQKPEATERTFSATIVNPSAGTPAGPWLRTGDSGFLSEGELFIMGRIKD